MVAPAPFDPVPAIAAELKLPPAGVLAVVRLLEEGNTVPFIARYRKEVTGGLDEVQIRAIEERRAYLLDLEDRRQTILTSIRESGKLTPELAAKIAAASTKAVLEDLYLPYKPKRRTRATIARERGLAPLAEKILAQPPKGDPRGEAAAFVGGEVPDVEAALAGARDIVAEVLTERPELRGHAREVFFREGVLGSKVAKGKAGEATKFEQYYDFSEAARTIPSHRYLAICRGEREDVLKVSLEVDEARLVAELERRSGLDRRSPFAGQLAEALQDGFRRLLAPALETEVRGALKDRSDGAAVDVFAENLKNLLLAPPLGPRAVIGVDPGLRTGCKCAAVDATGKLLGHVTLFLTRGDAALAKAKKDLVAFVRAHRPVAVAVGNGTGGRETEAFVKAVLAEEGLRDVFAVQVSESGASVYSASDVAREEFPDLDLTIRGAISIARRLQDPLAELVKLDPKAIGVGQYQHDVHQPLLGKKLGEVVEDCVNAVGVELNTASAELLSHVAGIGPKLAKKIVGHRDEHGPYGARKRLLDVSGLGPKAFTQCAGFLRIRGAKHPLDASAVHPERYALVEQMAKDLGVELPALVGNAALASKIDLGRYVGDGVGEPTLRDIVKELEKPGRDPRKSFEPPKFREDVTEVEHLKPGMVLEGVVTNVTAFGAFVDVGVHQDGLVHVSQLADRFIRDPKEAVAVGDRLTVRVLEVDLVRRRIALSAKSGAPAEAPRSPKESAGPRERTGPREHTGRGAPKGPRDGGRRDEQPPKDASGALRHNPFAKLKGRD